MLQKNLGLLLAGIWFIVTGLNAFLKLSFEGYGVVMAILAIVAGVLLVLAR